MMHSVIKNKGTILPVLLVMAGVSVFFMSCVEKKMTLKEAKQVSVSMRQSSFVPPPRSIDDILSVLNQPGKFNKNITAAIVKKADAKPPDTDDPGTLAEFFRDRGTSAKDLGRSDQELQDARTALSYARKTDKMTPKGMSNLLKHLGSAEVRLGNFKTGQAVLREGIDLFPTGSHYHLLAETLFKVGDFKGGSQLIKEGIDFCNKHEEKSGGKRSQKIQADRARLNAIYYGSLGQYKKAEMYWREFQTILETAKANRAAIFLMSNYFLAKNLKSQGRLIEAELQIREGLKGAVAHAGKNSGLTASMASFFAEILLDQGRIDDAQKLILASIDCYEKAGVRKDSLVLSKAKVLLGEVAFARKDFQGATKQFQDVKKDMALNQYYYNTKIMQNHNMMICFLISGHVEDTMNSITFFINNLKPFLGAKQYYSSEILGIRGMANFKMKKEKQAFNDFAKAIPLLFKEKTDEGDYLKTFRRRLIIESYLDLLVGIKESGREKEFNIQVAPIIFDLCERLNNSVVEGALGASGARAAANDPELADLVRKEQDATKQIDAIKQSITNIVGASADELNKLAISDLKANLNALTMAKNAFLEEIQIRFPKYIDFINPQPKGFFQVQNTLRNKEAMVIIYPFSTRTFIWGVPQSGHATFKIKSVNENDLKKEILRLRKSLAPDPEVFGDIPEFEFDLVHGLFTQLLKPVEASWQDAQDLLIVAPGSLGQIPFGILTTSKVILKKEKTLLYETYRDVPWLIKKVSISRIPSVAALVTLRSLPEASLDRKAFVGFGDPIFNLQQLSQEKKEKPHKIASRGVSLHVRGIKKVETDITTEKTSMNLSDLNRLPDTADEILSIANVLGADMVNDIFIGENASETNVKKVDLSNTKTIAFASHGLIPGDLDGLIQPAIALCSPEVTKDFDEDGLLTMGEILKLNLNADWVILSACNTGVGDGEGAEAVSGLGRSFFYAGARALLVTMWPVETTSAKLLTTGLFKYQKNDPGLSRAKALQASIVDLIDHQTLKDGETGKDIASYAHPFFWAPFIVVGDGG